MDSTRLDPGHGQGGHVLIGKSAIDAEEEHGPELTLRGVQDGPDLGGLKHSLPGLAFGPAELLGRWRGEGLTKLEPAPQLLVGMGEHRASVGKDSAL